MARLSEAGFRYTNSGMKRLLLIAHVFPPAPSPGAQRPGYLARYLAEFGWDVTVLTNSSGTAPFPARVISTAAAPGGTLEDRIRRKVTERAVSPDSLARRLLRTIKENVLFPDATAPWMPKAIAAGSKLLQSQKFDAIFSTAHPPSVHVVAWILARQSGLPWIADYRDPWAGNAYLKRPMLRHLAEELLERGMIKRAQAVTTVSEPIAQQLRRFHRRRDVQSIPNAYDPADWVAIPPVKPTRFDLVYTGSMYGGMRSPDFLFDAIAQLRAERNPAGLDARVHFYGPNSENVDASATQYGVNLVVRQHGSVPRAQAMRAQRSSALLIIFLNMDPATSGEMGSKYLEYLGARRPILAIGPPNSVMRSFIETHGLGWFASSALEAKSALQAAYERFSAGDIEMAVDPRGIPNAREMTLRFADLFDHTIGLERSMEQSIFMQGA